MQPEWGSGVRLVEPDHAGKEPKAGLPAKPEWHEKPRCRPRMLRQPVPSRRLRTERNSARPSENHECYVIFAGFPRQELLPRIHHLAFDCLGPFCSSFANGRVEPANLEGPVLSASCLN